MHDEIENWMIFQCYYLLDENWILTNCVIIVHEARREKSSFFEIGGNGWNDDHDIKY